jgi:hypothetical protein
MLKYNKYLTFGGNIYGSLKEISVVRLGQCCGVTIDKKHQTYIR